MNPLDQLRGMHLPTEPGLWPLAPGWWALALLAVAVLVLIVAWLKRRFEQRRYRREALVELSRLSTDGITLATGVKLIRRTALSACASSQWPHLPTEELLKHFDETSKIKIINIYKSVNNNDYLKLSNMVYRGDDNPDPEQRQALEKALSMWIRHHKRDQLC